MEDGHKDAVTAKIVAVVAGVRDWQQVSQRWLGEERGEVPKNGQLEGHLDAAIHQSLSVLLPLAASLSVSLSAIRHVPGLVWVGHVPQRCTTRAPSSRESDQRP